MQRSFWCEVAQTFTESRGLANIHIAWTNTYKRSQTQIQWICRFYSNGWVNISPYSFDSICLALIMVLLKSQCWIAKCTSVYSVWIKCILSIAGWLYATGSSKMEWPCLQRQRIETISRGDHRSLQSFPFIFHSLSPDILHSYLLWKCLCFFNWACINLI